MKIFFSDYIKKTFERLMVVIRFWAVTL